MRKDRTAQVVTLAIVALVLGVVVVRQTGWRPPSPAAKKEATPQDAIYAMLDAARAGDVTTYLGYYTGQIRATIEQAIKEKGKGGFADYLRQSNESIKGIAITEPEKLSPASVKARVEYVFQDRNEVQYMYLDRIGGRWLITRLDSTARIKTLVPYGTPVE